MGENPGRKQELRGERARKMSPPRPRKKMMARPRAGNAGLIASFVIALAGAAFGALAAFLSEFGSAATAARDVPPEAPAAIVLRDTTPRDEAVRRVIEGRPPERLAAPEIPFATATARPKIVVILDDMGVDPVATERALSFPGPLTYSFLPYAEGVERFAHAARERGGEVMLHLPMAPKGPDDPGPNALRADMTGGEFLRALEWNLSRFDGYRGVNNHMGSALTANMAAMKTVLAYLDARGLFFVDSVTTGASVARRAGEEVGARVLMRDVFLDATPGDRAEVRRQLELVERIAMETGYAVAIGHPRPETLDVLGPWLTSARARGFELTTPSALISPPAVFVSAPDLRG